MNEIIHQMTKAEVEKITDELVNITDNWWRKSALLLKDVRARNGHLAAGFKTFQDWCGSVDKRLADATQVKRVLDRTQVEENIGHELPAQHAYALSKLPTPEAQRDVYERVHKHFPKPQQLNFEAYVEGWFADHKDEADKRKRGDKLEKSKSGWSRADLEDDRELSDAFAKIESVYGHAERRAIQEGIIGLDRKNVIALAAFHASKMLEIHTLLMQTHWDVARCFKFVNKSLDQRDTIGSLINHCLGTKGLYYTTSVDGYDIQIRACHALEKKIRG